MDALTDRLLFQADISQATISKPTRIHPVSDGNV